MDTYSPTCFDPSGSSSGNYQIVPKTNKKALKIVEVQDVDGIQLAEDREKWLAIVNTVINVWFP
jgi:hypothetical protein